MNATQLGLTRSTSACLGALVALALASPGAVAQTWIGADGTWNTASNWSPSGVPSSTGTATFAGTGVTTLAAPDNVSQPSGDTTVSTIGSIVFASGAQGYTITETSPNNRFLWFPNNGGITVNAGVTTNQTIQAWVRNGWNFGSGSLSITNNGSGTLTLSNLTSNFPNPGSATSTVVFSGSGLTVVGQVLERTSTATTSIEKTGSGTLEIVSGGTSAPGSGSIGWFQGTTTINGGTLQLGDQNALGGSTASITFGGGTLRYSGSNSVDYSGRILSSTAAIAIDTAGQSVTFATPLPSTNVGGLTKLGSGSLALNAANLYSGTTTISGGTLALGASGSFASSPLIQVESGAFLNVAAVTGGFSLASTQTLGGRGSLQGAATFDSGAQLAFDAAGPLIATDQLSFTNFGISSLAGVNWDSLDLNSPYTLIDGNQDFASAGLLNFGELARTPVGTNREAYFQAGGDGGNALQLVVVPEPGTTTLAGLGLAAAAWALRRRAVVR